MRDAMLGDWGVKSIIPATPSLNTKYTKSVSWDIDTAYKLTNLSLVAFVSSYGPMKADKYVLNAEEVELTSTFTSGIRQQEDNSLNADRIESIYPVPSSGITNIIYNQTTYGNSSITITNMLGEIVKTVIATDKTAGEKQLTLDVSKYAKGVYFVTLYTPSGKHLKKLVVE